MLIRWWYILVVAWVFGVASLAHAQTCTAISLEGSGTSGDPFVIQTADDLVTMTDELNALDANVEPACWSAHYALTADVDLGFRNLEAVGGHDLQCNPLEDHVKFGGTFDGRNHVIENAYVVPSGGGCEGVFSMVRGATFQDVTFSGVDARTGAAYTTHVGTVAGSAAESTFRNVRVLGGAVKGDVAGGVVGKAFTSDATTPLTFEDVTYEGTVQAEGTTGGGGLIGWIARGGGTPVEITGASVEATVTGANQGVGGLAGLVEGPVDVNGATVRGTVGSGSAFADRPYRGGALGHVDVEGSPDVDVVLSGVDVHATVTEADQVGGLVGRVYGDGVDHDRLVVRGSRLLGSVRGSEEVGGIVGRVTDAHVDVAGFVSTPTAEARGNGAAGLVAGTLVGARLDVADAVLDGAVFGTQPGGTTGDGVGGVLGEGSSTQVTIERSRIAADVTGASGAFVGGAVGYLSNVNPISRLVARQVTVEGDLAGGGTENVGGILGYVRLGSASITDVHVGAATITGDAGAGIVGYAALYEDVQIQRAVSRAQVDTTTAQAGIMQHDGTGGLLVSGAYFTDAGAENPDGELGSLLTTEALQDYATFAAWSLTNGATPGTEAVWTFCGNDGPHLSLHAPDACPPADLASALEVAVPASVLRGMPFAVTVSAVDGDGALAPVLEASTLVLRASGGEEAGVLRRVGAPNAPATLVIASGSAVATADDLYFTGLSGEAGGDVVVTVSGTGGSVDGLSGTASAMSVRDVTLDVTYDGGPQEADGEDAAPVLVTLLDADGDPVAGRTVTLTTSLGTLWVGGEPSGTEAPLLTDAEGTVNVEVRSDVAGTARVTAACPGVCSDEVRIPFLGRRALTVVPGDGVAWAYPATFDEGVTVDAVQFRVDGGAWTDVEEDGVAGPFLVPDLTNDQAHAIELRALADGAAVALQGPATVTPAAPTPPAVTFEPPATSPTEATWDDDTLLVTTEVVLQHAEDAALENVWFVLTPGDDASVEAMEPEDGFVTREAGGWRWTGSPWPAGTPKTLSVTYRVPAPEGDDE
ncbi:MAG: Ig-like domain-containing protein [Trueperaceae bacterium]|nr:Ig-like domain-containing protein [Trueperaceae bacterium]